MNERIKKILKTIYFFPGLILNVPGFLIHNVRIPKGIECIGHIFIRNKGHIKIGKNVRIRSGFTSNPIGLGTKTVIRTFANGSVIIGNHVKMSNVCICSAKQIIIEDEVMIGGGVCIYDTDFHSINPFVRMELVPIKEIPKARQVKIEYGVFIGAGSIILKGVSIGRFSVIGAGSVVTGDIPPFEIWAGNPARFVRKLTKEEINATI